MTERSILPKDWNVPDIFHQRIGAQAGRQRAIFAEGHLLLILHAPPHPDELTREGRFFWRNPDGVWQSSSHGAGSEALSSHIEEFEKIIEAASRDEAAASKADDYFAVMEVISPVLRTSRHQHQVLQEARLLASADKDILNGRDRANQIERGAALIMEDARSGMEFLIAKGNEEQSRAAQRMAVSAHRLNILAASFLPIATLAGIFGTNLQHGFEAMDPPMPFLIVMGLGAVIGTCLARIISGGPPGSP